MEDSKGKKFLNNFKPSVYMKEKYGMSVDDSTFCIMPFIHTSTTTNGEFRLCCRSTKIWDIQNISLKELWNHKKYKTVRNNLMVGVRDTHCNACWKMEDKKITSLRQTQNFERLEEYSDLVYEYFKFKTLRYNVPVVELKLSNLCNLKCRMCWPKDSTPWLQDWDYVTEFYTDGERQHIEEIIEKNNLRKKPILNLFESNEQFVKDIEELLPTIKEFEFAGGEALIDPLHFKILEMIPKPEGVILKYSTNLTNLEAKTGRNVVDLWKKFKAVRLTISVDGYDELNAYIRHGSVWKDIVANVRYVKEQLGDKLDYIKASTTISALNVKYLVETLAAVRQDLDIPWHTSRLQWPSFLHANVLSIEELYQAKEKLLIELAKNEDDNIVNINNNRHLSDAVAWVDECVKNNRHGELYGTFLEFNKRLDQRRNEKFIGIDDGVL